MLDPDKAAKLKAMADKMKAEDGAKVDDKPKQPEESPEYDGSMEFDPFDDDGMNPEEPEDDDIMPDEVPGEYSASDLKPEEISADVGNGMKKRGMIPRAAKERLGGLTDAIRRASGSAA